MITQNGRNTHQFVKKKVWGGTAWIQHPSIGINHWTWVVSAKLRVVQMSHEKRGTAIQISLNADDSIFQSFSGKFRGVFEMFRYFDFGLQELIPMCECKDIGIVAS